MNIITDPHQVKARKEHRCDFCCERISIGELYETSTYSDCGDIYNWKAHNRCSELADRLNLYDEVVDGVTADYFMEAISEKYMDILIGNIPIKDNTILSDLMSQLDYVPFNKKLWYVIRYFNKIDEQ